MASSDWIVRTTLIETAFWLAKMASSSGTNVAARRGKLVCAIDWRLVEKKSIVQTYWTSSYFVKMRKMNKIISNPRKRLPLKCEKFIGQIATSVNWKQEIGSISAAAKSFKHFRYTKRRLRQISSLSKSARKARLVIYQLSVWSRQPAWTGLWIKAPYVKLQPKAKSLASDFYYLPWSLLLIWPA